MSTTIENNENDQTLNIDVTVTSENLENDLFKIYKQLFKDVEKDELVIEELAGGYINSIVKLSLKKDKNKSLIFRTFGMKFNSEEFSKKINEKNEESNNANKETNSEIKENLKPESKKFEMKENQILEDKKDETKLDDKKIKDLSEILFSRITEYKVMNEISKHGLCKKVYAKYNNGICYGYTAGTTLNGPLMLTNDFLQEMATKLAKFHSIKYEIPEIKFKTHYERVYEQTGPAFLGMLLEIDKKTALINEEPFTLFPRANILIEEQKVIGEILKELGYGRIAFCHNDCNQKNIIWDSQNRSLGFIDFEMTMNNYVAMEIGYIFGCFPGHFLYDFNGDFFPNKDYRVRFIRKYLKEFNTLNKINLTPQQFDDEVDELYARSNLTSLELLLRFAMIGPFFDFNPAMLQNEDLIKSRKEVKYFCTRFSLDVYNLYKELKDEFIQEAKKYLDKKKQIKKETEV